MLQSCKLVKGFHAWIYRKGKGDWIKEANEIDKWCLKVAHAKYDSAGEKCIVYFYETVRQSYVSYA